MGSCLRWKSGAGSAGPSRRTWVSQAFGSRRETARILLIRIGRTRHHHRHACGRNSPSPQILLRKTTLSEQPIVQIIACDQGDSPRKQSEFDPHRPRIALGYEIVMPVVPAISLPHGRCLAQKRPADCDKRGQLRIAKKGVLGGRPSRSAQPTLSSARRCRARACCCRRECRSCRDRD